MRVALIYNLKKEVTPQSELEFGQAHTLPHDDSGDGSSANPSSFFRRENDLYAEWDTMETIAAVRGALEERHEIILIEADEGAFSKILENRPDFAFNMAEGLHGVSREAQVPAILEMFNIPYLGSDPLTLAICLDKSRTKEILSYHKIPTAPFSVIRSMETFEDARVRFPAIVKPLHEGSSKGIYNSCVVHDTDALEREVRAILEVYGQPALVEEYLPGREFTVAIMGNGDSVRTLPIVEIRFDALPKGVNHIYSYEAKWIWDTSDKPLEIFECPAVLDEQLEARITTICRDAYAVLNCRDWARIDVRLNAEANPMVLEVNPLPGILPRPEDNSCFPKAARVAGMSYSQLINSVLDIAVERYQSSVHKQTLPTARVA
jgi:D-alanine-D-alanine ligase